MKYLKSITYLLLFALVFSSGCKKDGADFTLNYDGSNNTAPELAEGFFESGALFPAGFDGNDEGNELYKIDFFIKDTPQSAEIRVYLDGRNEDNLVYSAPVLSNINRDDWNGHELSTPVILDGKDLFVSLNYSQQENRQTLGCDSGPSKTNGNWHFDSTTNEWRPFLDITGADINWNIRALVRSPE